MRLIFLSFLLIFFSCSSEKNNKVLVTNTGETQGTFYHIKYLIKDGVNLQPRIENILSSVDSSLSTYVPYSLISKINYRQDNIVDSLFETVFNCAQLVHKQTEGAFDCSIAPLVNAWGFGFEKKQNLDSLKIKKILKNIGFDKIYIKNDSLNIPKNMMIDFNALAQGFTVDLIAKFLDDNSITDYLIEIGGELKSKGSNASDKIWRVGVDKPIDEIDLQDRFQFIMKLENKSIATSGNYRKYFEENGKKYSHTISPFNGYPVMNNFLSVSVIHDDCMLADAYATAFMVMGKSKTLKFLDNFPEIEAYIVYTDKNGKFKTYISEKMVSRIINY
jgi:thiamine biosynthesis lipoprotein|tara:strand:+ start:1538 stop:2533 length:996 start_codon:yes stop_codon:yes gene_type:complete